MDLKLRCPVCGFNFEIFTPDDISDEELEDIKTCPCGQLMDEVDEVFPLVLDI